MRADGEVAVKITGNEADLVNSLRSSDRALGGLATKGVVVGAAIAGAGLAVADFGASALAEADRVGDALFRLEDQIGTGLAGAVDDASDSLTDLGLSRGDVLELAAAFGDVATTAGLADEKIAPFAIDAAKTAGALSLITDLSPDEVIAAIGKAADGSEKAMRLLGINMTDAEVAQRALRDTGKDLPEQLTDTELAAAAYALVLEKLAPRVDAVADGEVDHERALATLEAKFETLTGKIGEHLDGPLTALLDWLIDGIAAWEYIADNVDLFDDALDAAIDSIKGALGPLGLLIDGLKDALKLFGLLPGQSVPAYRPQNSPNPDRQVNTTTEAQVIQVIRDYELRNGLTIL